MIKVVSHIIKLNFSKISEKNASIFYSWCRCQVDLAMALGISDAHSSYLNSQKTALLVTNNILANKFNTDEAILQKVITRLERLPGMTKETSEINRKLADVSRQFPVVNQWRIVISETNDNASSATVYSSFKDDNGTIRLFVNKLNVHHVYVFDNNEICQVGGYVGWLHTSALQEELKSIKNNFCF